MQKEINTKKLLYDNFHNEHSANGLRYSRMDQVKSVENIL